MMVARFGRGGEQRLVLKAQVQISNDRQALCQAMLVDGEHGVSPGQACVFYDAGEGQARVLGGGFIQSATAKRAAADGAAKPTTLPLPLVEAMRG